MVAFSVSSRPPQFCINDRQIRLRSLMVSRMLLSPPFLHCDFWMIFVQSVEVHRMGLRKNRLFQLGGRIHLPGGQDRPTSTLRPNWEAGLRRSDISALSVRDTRKSGRTVSLPPVEDHICKFIIQLLIRPMRKDALKEHLGKSRSLHMIDRSDLSPEDLLLYFKRGSMMQRIERLTAKTGRWSEPFSSARE